MKICLINSFYAPDILGGAEISVKILAENLIKRKHEVFIICSDKEDKIEYINGVKIYRIKNNNVYTPKEYIQNNNSINKFKKIIYKSLEVCNIFNERKISNILKIETPDVVHVNNIYGISSIVWRSAKRQNIKVVQTLRDYFIMCPKSTLIKNSNKQCKDVNIICKIYRYIYKYLSKNIDYVTAPSNHTLNKFIEQGYFRNIKSKCVYNASNIDIDKINAIYLSKQNRNHKKLKFIYLGALVEHKGVKELVSTFKNIKSDIPVELHLAGKGNLEEYINSVCLEEENIFYHGFLSGDILEAFLLEGDILIAPSKWEEPFGRIVLDAYKYAMPVIVSNNGGLKEIVKNNCTGIVLDEVNEKNIKEAINYFTVSPDKINIMLSEAKKLLLKFSIENQIDKFEQIYMELNNGIKNDEDFKTF